MQTIATFLPYIQIGLAVILTGLILLQQSEASIGSAFGGDAFGATYRTRRGGELFIFRSTMIVAILFVISALAHIFLK